jgi:hypothetical protein
MNGKREATVKRAIFVLALVATPLLADEVHLRGGGRLTGEIVEETADNITVDIGAGKMTVRKSTVVRIERSASPLQEYRAHAANLAADDIEGWRKLARWASGEGLSTQAREAWTHVTALYPDDAEANRGLGLVQHNGQWMTEEESYRSQGFIDFEGEWMMPAEKQAILEERRASEEADRQALAAQTQADQAAAQEAQAREAAEDAEFWDDNLPGLGDPVYWGGYGYSPTLWPVQPGRPSRPANLPARGGRR